MEWYLIFWAVAGGGIVALCVCVEEWLFSQFNHIVLSRRDDDE